VHLNRPVEFKEWSRVRFSEGQFAEGAGRGGVVGREDLGVGGSREGTVDWDGARGARGVVWGGDALV